MKSKETSGHSKSEMCSGRNYPSIEQDIHVKCFSCGFLNVGTIIVKGKETGTWPLTLPLSGP